MKMHVIKLSTWNHGREKGKRYVCMDENSLISSLKISTCHNKCLNS